MKKYFFLKSSLFIVFLLMLQGNFLNAQSSLSDFLENNREGLCYFVGQVSVPAITITSLASCSSGNAASCKLAGLALTCQGQPSCEIPVSMFSEGLCNYVLEQVGDTLFFMGKAEESEVDKLKETFEYLDSIEGINWSMKQLTQ